MPIGLRVFELWFRGILAHACDNKMETVRIGNKDGDVGAERALAKVESYENTADPIR
ncbi:hypothetical protein [Candidatus Accumulibacter sp. ACC005]|uniref:hypothetical protein n=1 Tax=Candidatus Accumulibacter sp. ACC005 TaxID=2823331 RepID=UPI0025BBB806|nr:hypothetical protein [Candidatus Accumulibacter sp. ACC005]